MIYVVVGVDDHFEYVLHENFFASSSKDKAELEKIKLEENQERLNLAASEYFGWIKNNLYNKSLSILDKLCEIELKYNVKRKDFYRFSRLTFLIEEVPTDDDN